MALAAGLALGAASGLTVGVSISASRKDKDCDKVALPPPTTSSELPAKAQDSDKAALPPPAASNELPAKEQEEEPASPPATSKPQEAAAEDVTTDEASAPADAEHERVMALTPREVLANLKRGNDRFRKGVAMRPEEGAALISKQFPSVAVLGCADSRLPIESAFDQGVGDVFVVGVVGNCMTTNTKASLQYAVHTLKVKVLVVLGHEFCGTLEAAMLPFEELKKEPMELAQALLRVRVALNLDVLDKVQDQRVRDREAAYTNVKRQLRILREDAGIMAKVEEGELLIVGAFYEISTGKVDFFHEIVPEEVTKKAVSEEKAARRPSSVPTVDSLASSSVIMESPPKAETKKAVSQEEPLAPLPPTPSSVPTGSRTSSSVGMERSHAGSPTALPWPKEVAAVHMPTLPGILPRGGSVPALLPQPASNVVMASSPSGPTLVPLREVAATPRPSVRPHGGSVVMVPKGHQTFVPLSQVVMVNSPNAGQTLVPMTQAQAATKKPTSEEEAPAPKPTSPCRKPAGSLAGPSVLVVNPSMGYQTFVSFVPVFFAPLLQQVLTVNFPMGNHPMGNPTFVQQFMPVTQVVTTKPISEEEAAASPRPHSVSRMTTGPKVFMASSPGGSPIIVPSLKAVVPVAPKAPAWVVQRLTSSPAHPVRKYTTSPMLSSRAVIVPSRPVVLGAGAPPPVVRAPSPAPAA